MQIRSDQNDEMFVISGLENVWVMADVYESNISRCTRTLRPVTTLAYPGKGVHRKDRQGVQHAERRK